MRTLFICLISSFLVVASCKKENDYFRKDAEIIGYDIAQCECCGGFMVRMAEGGSARVYRAFTLPESTGINPDSYFPISVEIDYKTVKSDCGNDIEVLRLREK